jgi:hypothetical protein
MSPPADYTATLPTKRMGAGLLITDDVGRVLLVEPTYKSEWEIPGGAVEANESPYCAARRGSRRGTRPAPATGATARGGLGAATHRPPAPTGAPS